MSHQTSKRRRPHPSLQAPEVHFRENLNHFLAEGWSITQGPLLTSIPDGPDQGSVNWTCVSHMSAGLPHQVFGVIFSDSFWDCLCGVVNHVMNEKVGRREISVGRKKYYNCVVTRQELVQCYAIFILAESHHSQGEQHLEANYRHVCKEKIQELLIGLNRFLAILGSMVPNSIKMTQLIKILHQGM